MAIENESGVALRVREIIARTFGVDVSSARPLKMGDPPQWDSIGHMDLIMAVEQEFGVTFASFELAQLQSADAITKAVAERSGR
jgi:acyl carrier protein